MTLSYILTVSPKLVAAFTLKHDPTASESPPEHAPLTRNQEETEASPDTLKFPSTLNVFAIVTAPSTDITLDARTHFLTEIALLICTAPFTDAALEAIKSPDIDSESLKNAPLFTDSSASVKTPPDIEMEDPPRHSSSIERYDPRFENPNTDNDDENAFSPSIDTPPEEIVNSAIDRPSPTFVGPIKDVSRPTIKYSDILSVPPIVHAYPALRPESINAPPEIDDVL
jgi:hypothetical protein